MLTLGTTRERVFWKLKLAQVEGQIGKVQLSVGSQSTQCPWTTHVASNQSAVTLGRSVTTHLCCFLNFSLGILFEQSFWSGPEAILMFFAYYLIILNIYTAHMHFFEYLSNNYGFVSQDYFLKNIAENLSE